MPSIKKNTIANYLGQAYTTLIGIVFLPFYLHYLGAEAYGLVGFFAVMQAWLQLLDMGLSPTLTHQVAHVRGIGEGKYIELRQLLRSIELVFLVLGVAIALGIWLGSPWVSENWLNVKSLPLGEVAYCITLMGVITGLRWFTSLYRSGIQGMEQQVWLNSANAAVATLRYIGAWVLLRWVTQKPQHFFEFQLIVSIVELVVIGTKFYHCLPKIIGNWFGFSWQSLKTILPFTGAIAYSSAIWILLTQFDKLILSHVLSLKEYGYFALVVTVSTSILSFTSPISSAILPRMTMLFSQGKEVEMLAIYRKATRLMAAIMFPITGTVAMFSTELLYAWTGDRSAANWAGPILKWFALGNGILAISGFQYMLQFVHGKLSLHVVFSTINALVQVPILVFVAFKYGAIGVALAFFMIRLITFFIWPAVVHNKLAPGLHYKWLFHDVAISLLPFIILLLTARNVGTFLYYTNRIQTISILIATGLTILALNLAIFKLQGRIYD